VSFPYILKPHTGLDVFGAKHTFLVSFLSRAFLSVAPLISAGSVHPSKEKALSGDHGAADSFLTAAPANPIFQRRKNDALCDRAS